MGDREKSVDHLASSQGRSSCLAFRQRACLSSLEAQLCCGNCAEASRIQSGGTESSTAEVSSIMKSLPRHVAPPSLLLVLRRGKQVRSSCSQQRTRDTKQRWPSQVAKKGSKWIDRSLRCTRREARSPEGGNWQRQAALSSVSLVDELCLSVERRGGSCGKQAMVWYGMVW